MCYWCQIAFKLYAILVQYYKSLSVIFQLPTFQLKLFVLFLLIFNLLKFLGFFLIDPIGNKPFGLKIMDHPWFTQCHYLTLSKSSCNYQRQKSTFICDT